MNPSPLFIYSELLRDTLPELPVVSRPAPQTIDPAGEDKAPIPTKRSLNILCIDDDEQILEMMKECLSPYTHRVRVASGGKHGIELFRTAILKSEPYEVVITDLGMPDMDGYQVSRAIKAESPHTPIIMMTGGGMMTKEGGETTAAVDVVVAKPPRISELNDLLLRIAKPAQE